MGKRTGFRCTYEWDVVAGKDDRDDKILRRHICNRDMHHEGKHKSKSGHTSDGPPPKVK